MHLASKYPKFFLYEKRRIFTFTILIHLVCFSGQDKILHLDILVLQKALQSMRKPKSQDITSKYTLKTLHCK